MRSPFLQLLLKESKQALGAALVFTGILVAIIAYLITRIGNWPGELVLLITVSLTGFVPYWALWRIYYSLRQEWTGDHMYLLLGLPIPGWYITSSKVIVALVEMFVYLTLILGAGIFVWYSMGETQLPIELFVEYGLIGTAIRLSLLSLGGLLIGMLIIQFSHLASRLVSKRRGLMMILLALLSTWFVLRVGGLVAPIFSWLPSIPMDSVTVLPGGVVETATVYIGIAPLLGALLVSLFLFWLGSNLLERDIEL